MSLSFLSRFSACRSSLVRLLSVREADCIVEAILLLMLSLVGSDNSLWRDRTASTLDTIVSVGIRFGVTECFSPYERTWVSVLSKGREEIFLTQFSSVLWRFLFLVRWSRVSFSSVLMRYCSVVFLARWSAMSRITSSKLVGISCLSLSSRCCSLLL